MSQAWIKIRGLVTREARGIGMQMGKRAATLPQNSTGKMLQEEL
jgi:hypothetical protein